MLEIPTVTISDSTNSRFRNLIALEQSGKDEATYFTNYVLLLDCLINTSSDVALLRECGIITSVMGSDEEVSKMINKLCKGSITNQYGAYGG
ncbi:hypothetical protein IFM89_006880 [Coptis chinensis]|uniref:Uncharacterized protein n=1 Tax=Coptis chinensis TaxID=261450 RepID=A0A835GUX0_9MAGN|nr:hypothetical protein IFM89_006880 [Coptis chinensis]